MILDRLESPGGDQVSKWLGSGLERQRADEVADYGRGDGLRLWEPLQQGALCPLRYKHEAVDLRNQFSLHPPDGAESEPIMLDEPGCYVFVGMTRTVKCEDHRLIRPVPYSQGGPGGQWVLGIDDALPRLGEVPSESVTDEYLVEVPPPQNFGWPAEWLNQQARAEHRNSEAAPP